MQSPIPDYLAETLGDIASDTSGALADYIPELAAADPERLGAAFAMVDGAVYGVGDVDTEFTIQSISKPFAYALALADRGFDAVLAKVGVEPSGEAFNELSLEGGTGRPLNPMINAGAITAHSLVGPEGIDATARLERVVDGLSAFAGRRLMFDDSVCASELEHAHRNLAIAHMLRSYNVITEDPATVVEGYTRQCSLLVTTLDLAVMAATLANHGVNPVSGERVVPEPVVRQVLSVMFSCGMYDAAGDWATQVGIPAKSGVAGGLIGALPGQIGIATFSPRLDVHGNSVRGVGLFGRFSSDMGLHVMEVPAASRAVVRSNHVVGEEPDAVRVIQLQGGIRFAGAERVIREVTDTAPAEHHVKLDLTMAYSIDDVARRMLLEIVRRLTLDGHEVSLIDPEGILAVPISSA
ncbi:glutaminase [Mycolicibacterium parafortuitum]|uniref:Glutaminase n=1 Tax=Mycolicibacterium parafortuitum TaxID=39692 RepID=A0A375YNH2_MYCPF|nr:glutaminase [Mycolicibacterium parafortuitum]ORB29190.1 glutaminase [Mycolicibacterium parafortuitum]SRX82707.1 glutaminase 1 [Rothia dentocariosa ATCC] [Mycolicibacterium parafortuitum]